MSSSEQATAHAMPAQAEAAAVGVPADVHDDDEGGVGLREWPSESPRMGITPLGRLAAVSVALPVLPVLVLLVLHLTYHPTPPKTGDPLLDGVLGAMEMEYPVATAEDNRPYEYNPQVLPARALRQAALNSSVSDSRRWLLLSILAKWCPDDLEGATDKANPSEQRRRADELREQESLAYLQSGWENGCADGPLLYRLFCQQEQAWLRQSWPQIATDPNHGQTVDSRLAQFSEARENVDRLHRAEEEQLLSALQTAAPDEAIPLYCAAQVAAERGDYAVAIRLLGAGNRMPHCSALLGFPHGLIRSLSSPAQASTSLANLYGLESALSYYNRPLGSGRFDVMPLLLKEASERGDSAGLQVLRMTVIRLSGKSHWPRELYGFEPAIVRYWPETLDSRALAALSRDTSGEQQFWAVHVFPSRVGVPPAVTWFGVILAVSGALHLDDNQACKTRMQLSQLEYSATESIRNSRTQVPPSPAESAFWQQLEQFDYTKVLAPSEPAGGH